MEKRLEIWARNGNVELALERARTCGSDGLAALLRRIKAAPIPAPRVFAPLVDKINPVLSLVSTLSVREDTNHVGLSDLSALSVERHFDLAWTVAGGSGPRPRLGLEPEVVRGGGVGPIEGSSLGLGSFLAALAHFTATQFTQNVLATGSFDDPIDLLSEKRALGVRVQKQIDANELLVASSERQAFDAAATRHSFPMRLVVPQQAAEASFGHCTWHPSAPEIKRFHVYCAATAHQVPARWQGLAHERIHLHDRLEPQHLEEIVTSVLGRLAPHDRCELSLEGPNWLAAKLGVTMANKPFTVQVLHLGEPWGNNRGPAEPMPMNARGSIRCIVSNSALAVDGWETLEIRANMVASDVSPVLRDLLHRCSQASEVHLAFKAPLAIAWLMASALRFRPFSVYRLNQDRSVPYTLVFEHRPKM